MNKKRYWKRIGNYVNIVYHNSKDEVLTRAFNLGCEIGNYLFNLDD